MLASVRTALPSPLDRFLRMVSFQVCAHQIDQVLGKLRGNLLFRAVDKMEADMCLKHLGHQRIHASAHGCQQHQLPAAIFIGVDEPLDRIQLPAQAADPLQQFQLLSFVQRHGVSSWLDNTHPRYSMNGVGV